MSGEGFLDNNKGHSFQEVLQLRKDNSTESQTVATIEKGFNLTIICFHQLARKLHNLQQHREILYYIVGRSICLHNYDVLDDFAFIYAVSFKLIK